MQFTRLFDQLLPTMCSGKISLSLNVSPFSMLQGSWSLVAGQPDNNEAMQISKDILSNLDEGWPSTKNMSLARALVFEDSESDTAVSPTFFPDTPVALNKKRARKAKTPVVQPVNCHFTMSCLNQDGYRPQPILTVHPNINKKSRAKLLLMDKENETGKGKDGLEQSARRKVLADDKNEPAHSGEEVDIPVTPIVCHAAGGICPRY
jgi:hypothetical protein